MEQDVRANKRPFVWPIGQGAGFQPRIDGRDIKESPTILRPLAIVACPLARQDCRRNEQAEELNSGGAGRGYHDRPNRSGLTVELRRKFISTRDQPTELARLTKSAHPKAKQSLRDTRRRYLSGTIDSSKSIDAERDFAQL